MDELQLPLKHDNGIADPAGCDQDQRPSRQEHNEGGVVREDVLQGVALDLDDGHESGDQGHEGC